jgi:hypothetical protein
MKVQGTTNTGTEVQTAQDRSDIELTTALTAAFAAAEKDAERFIFSTAKLATAIMDVHDAEVWKRTIDGETGKLYSSARSYYQAIGSRFPLLHKLLRDEVVAELYSADPNAIGVRELAALVHVDPAQVTRSRQRVLAAAAAEAEAADKAAAAEAAAEAVATAAAEAAAEAAANGASEAEAAAAADAVVRFATAAAEAEAKAAAEAEANAEADAVVAAEVKANKRAMTNLENALKVASDRRHLLTAEDAAAALKMAQENVKAWLAFDKLLREAEAVAVAPKPQPKPRRAASA